MAVRPDQDRRVGGDSEKFLTLEEVAQRLALPADEVEALIRRGTLPSFRLGGSLLRVRVQDLEALQLKGVSGRRPVSRSSPARPDTLWERIVDFFYFHDFYIVVLLVLLVLLTIILTL